MYAAITMLAALVICCPAVLAPGSGGARKGFISPIFDLLKNAENQE
jgi:hypothetical protein